MRRILVTDTLFILPEHEDRLRAAGFTVERLAKPDASEAELVEALKGKVGYILGGTERVSDEVIRSTDMLKVIAFTGADWQGFIPGYRTARQKGIIITNTPGANSFAVAEYTVALLLMMVRRLLELGRTGNETFRAVDSLADLHIGICGMGRIGERVTRMLRGMGPARISYWNRTRKPHLEAELGIRYCSPEEIFGVCDIVSNHLSSQAGQFISRQLLQRAKANVLFINTGSHETFDIDALYEQLAHNGARAAFDFAIDDDRYKDLPIGTWFCSNSSAAYNTHEACKKASDMATDSIIRVLTKGTDRYSVTS